MAKEKGGSRKNKRPIIKLMCEGCKQSFYSTRKNPINSPDRLIRKKFCKTCRAHKPHKETK